MVAHASADEQKKFYDPVVKRLEGWSIKVDPKLLENEHKKFKLEVFDALANHLQRSKYILPDVRVKELQQLPIWLDYNYEPLGNMQYHPGVTWLRANKHDPRLVKHVHIPRAKALLSRSQWAKHPYVILHELAHAYQKAAGIRYEPPLHELQADCLAGVFNMKEIFWPIKRLKNNQRFL